MKNRCTVLMSSSFYNLRAVFELRKKGRPAFELGSYNIEFSDPGAWDCNHGLELNYSHVMYLNPSFGENKLINVMTFLNLCSWRYKERNHLNSKI